MSQGNDTGRSSCVMSVWEGETSPARAVWHLCTFGIDFCDLHTLNTRCCILVLEGRCYRPKLGCFFDEVDFDISFLIGCLLGNCLSEIEVTLILKVLKVHKGFRRIFKVRQLFKLNKSTQWSSSAENIRLLKTSIFEKQQMYLKCRNCVLQYEQKSVL